MGVKMQQGRIEMKKQMRVKNLSYLHAGYGRRQLIFLLGMLAMMLIPVSGYAKGPCDELGNNIEWTGGLQEIIMMMQANDMEGAKKKAKALSEICATAPLLNYLQGKIAESTNEKKEALYFYQKASENTYTFAVAPDTAKKIWYARYESEYPDRTESAVAEREAQISSLHGEYAKLDDEKQDLISDVMWAGAGIGLAGIAIAGGGIGMLFASRNDKYERVNLEDINLKTGKPNIDDSIHSYKYKPVYLAGWAMVGAGAVLAISGAVLTGVYGYQYTHPLKDESISWQISPLDISLQIAF